MSWKAVPFYTEGEYVFAAGESGQSFSYSWSELTVAPTGWFRASLGSRGACLAVQEAF